MKAKTITTILTALLLTLSVSSFSVDPQLQAELLTDFKNSLPQIGKLIGCATCTALKNKLVSTVDLIGHNTEFIFPVLCALNSKYGDKSMSTKNCIKILGFYKPILLTTFTRLVVEKNDFICGLLLKSCASPDLSFFDHKSYIARILKDAPKTNTRPKPSGKGTYTVLQINDIHIDREYTPGSVANCKNNQLCCRSGSIVKDGQNAVKAGRFGFRGSCDLPQLTFEDWLLFAKEKFSPDFVMWLGDNENHELYASSKEDNLNTTSFIAEKMRAAFPDTPFWLSIGNHEGWPVDNYDMLGLKDAYLLPGLSKAYEQLLGEEEVKQIKRYGYYSQDFDTQKLKIISLFGMSFDNLNFYAYFKAWDPLGQLSWLEKQFADAEEKGYTVFILSHIPIGDDFSVALWMDIFSALSDRYQNSIGGIFAAHTHADHLKFFQRHDGTNKLTAVNLISPSLTTLWSTTPSFRVYHIDKETNQIVDYDQYRLDLNKWNAAPEGQHAEWDLV